MSEELKLGQIITAPQNRDAIHIAVVPMVAADKLRAGEKVWLENGLARLGAINSIGVVDPFLSVSVQPGETFWLFLNPGSITSLRHEWTHPALPNEQPAVSPGKAASERWLREFTEGADCPGYETVMRAVEGFFARGDDYYSSGGYIDDEYMHFNGLDAHGDIPPEFWAHAEIVLGKKLATRPTYFSCSC